MKRKYKNIFKISTFLLLLLGLVGAYTATIPNMSIKYYRAEGFELEENSDLDICIMGNSNAYSGVVPAIIYKETELKAYNSGYMKAGIKRMLTFEERLFEYQNPKLIIVETDALWLDMKTDSYQVEEYGYYEKIYKNHDYWRRTSNIKEVMRNKGYIYSEKRFLHTENGKLIEPTNDYLKVTPQLHLISEKVTLLDKFVGLARENGTEVMFLSLPCPSTSSETFQADLNNYCETNNIKHLDFNYPENLDNYNQKINISKDTQDWNHLNIYGARKATEYLSYFIKQNYDIEPSENEGNFKSLSERFYKKHKKALETD